MEFCAVWNITGWIEVETDKSYVQRVNFKEYAVKVIKTLLDIADGKQIEYHGIHLYDLQPCKGDRINRESCLCRSGKIQIF